MDNFGWKDILPGFSQPPWSKPQKTEAEILSGHGMDFRRPMYGKTKVDVVVWWWVAFGWVGWVGMGRFGGRDFLKRVHTLKFNSSPLKNDGWKTILSYWEGNLSGASC